VVPIVSVVTIVPQKPLFSVIARKRKAREPVKVGRAGGGGNGFVREFRLVGQKKQNHDAGWRITLTWFFVLLYQDKRTDKNKYFCTAIAFETTKPFQSKPSHDRFYLIYPSFPGLTPRATNISSLRDWINISALPGFATKISA